MSRSGYRLLPLSDAEKKYVEHKNFKLFFKGSYGSHEFDIGDIVSGNARYVGYEGDKLDAIESLMVDYYQCFDVSLDELFDFLKKNEDACVKMEMYNLAFNLKNIRDNIWLYKYHLDNPDEPYFYVAPASDFIPFKSYTTCQVIIINKGEKVIKTPREFLYHFGFMPDQQMYYRKVNPDSCLCECDIKSSLSAKNIPYKIIKDDFYVEKFKQ